MKILIKTMLIGVMLFTGNILIAQNIIIKFNNDSQFAPLITSVQKITFSDDKLFVDMKTGTDNSYNITDIRKIYFGNVTDNNVPESVDNQKILVYPNPASSFLILNNLPQSGSLCIYSMSGAKVSEQTISDTQMQIDIENLTPGLYVLKVNQSTLKFIRQ